MDAPIPPIPPPLPLNAAEVQSIKDTEHLRLLHYGYYITGGFTALFASIFLFHFFMGLAILLGGLPMSPPPHRPHPPHHAVRSPADIPGVPPPPVAATPTPTSRPFSPDNPVPGPADQPGPPDDDRPGPPEFPFPERFIGLIFMTVGGIIVLGGWTIGGLTAYAGRCLRDRKHPTFILIMAGLNCLHTPFGTLLGVFTFIVLNRPTVQAMYYHQPTPPRV